MTGAGEAAMDEVAVIGAGFAGVGMAIALARAGVKRFTVFEKAEDVGGVWRDNIYPGAACDLPSHLYSYSFQPHDRWTRTYASQPEILDYLRQCAASHGVLPHLRFGSEITRARYDARARAWRLETASGREHVARVLVTATGQLGRPKLPDIPGLTGFRGQAFHSARWQPGQDFTGRTVAVIGNGCSAVQIVPRLAGTAKRLLVFQRSPKWVIPKWDREYGTVARWLFARLPWLQTLNRALWFLLAEIIAFSPVRRGLFARLLATLARWHLHRQVADPVLRWKLTPSTPFGCNRMILSNDYYPALGRPNVELVTDEIVRARPAGIETADGRIHCVDTIVYATGFESTRFLAPLEVIGRNGSLSALWRDGAAAFLGVAVPGFPNFFMLYGPNTSSTSNSIIYMLECQVSYVMKCLDLVRREETMEVRESAFVRYQNQMASWLGDTVWNAGCRSWYKTEAGRVTNTWPLRALRYRWATRRPARRDFVAVSEEGRT